MDPRSRTTERKGSLSRKGLSDQPCLRGDEVLEITGEEPLLFFRVGESIGP